jgi:hypothetical protein
MGQIEEGTVGWGDEGDHYLKEAGRTLFVKVTLFSGYVPGTDPAPAPGRAGGRRVLARVGGPMIRIPPDGARVMVAIPTGRELETGSGVILTEIAVAPDIQFSATRVKLDFGEDCDLVLKGRSVTISDYENRYLVLGPTYGFKVGDDTSAGCQLKNSKWTFFVTDDGDATGVLEIADGKVRVAAKAGSLVSGFSADASGGDFTVTGKRFVSYTDAGVLGRTALPASGICALPMVGLVPTPSLTWVVSVS